MAVLVFTTSAQDMDLASLSSTSFFEGGGFCSNDTDCAHRAGTYYGGTADDAPSISLAHPFFAPSHKDNPLMWNWNHVMLRYCDGAYFSGTRQKPVLVKGTSVHYQGYYITTGLLEDLGARYKLRASSDVVFSGCSAGGIRIYAHLDALRAMLPSGVRVSGLADSGFYLDKHIFTPLKHFVVKGQGGTWLLNKHCLKDNRGVEERCLIGSINAQYLKTPLFAWQSQYDTDQRTCEMTAECAKSRACVQAYGDELATALRHKLLSNSEMGAFVDSCSRHCTTTGLPHDDVSGLTPLQAFAAWYDGRGRTFGQLTKFPCDTCCMDDSPSRRILFML
mmetsp:Transcript_65073/g.167785  ORF Transcript_65073/g.167785 Transcript_65073/m.167785 type:complete len:334 (+) Transcript_65073:282-1283(+)